MTEEELDLVIADFESGKSIVLVKSLRGLEENLPQIRRAVMQKMGREEFTAMMKSNRENQNQLLNNTIAQINYLISTDMTVEQIDDFSQVLEGTLIELSAKKDLMS